MNTKSLIKIISINTSILIVIFLILETLARLFFPELSNDIHKAPKKPLESGLTQGLKFHSGLFNGKTKLPRVSSPQETIQTNNDIFLTIGDSVSFGLGNSYEDIYWRRMERKYNLINKNKEDFLKFISLGIAGKNLSDSVENLKLFYDNHYDTRVKYLMYQFNYNDITPYTKSAIKKIARTRNIFLNKRISIFRNEHLGKSTFINYLRLKSKKILRKTSGTCSERGVGALGQYTWTFIHKDFEDESNNLWDEFKKELIQIKKLADSKNTEFLIFISPLVYDIDELGMHKHYNSKGIDFSCKTIEPSIKLKNIAEEIGIKIFDPTQYLKKSLEARIKEGNFKPYYFAGDDNHFNELGGEYIAEYLFHSIFKF